MTLREAEAVLRELSYKPNWELKWSIMSHGIDSPPGSSLGSLVVQIMAQVVDAGGRGPTDIHTLVEYNEVTLGGLDEEMFLRLMFDRFVNMEQHEAREWFKRKGVALYDPHPKLKGIYHK